MHHPDRPVHVALAFTALGFGFIVLGWNGAAGLDRVPGQIPYLLSGGLVGLGLIVVGATVALVTQLRRNNAALLTALEQLADPRAAPTTGPTAVPGRGPTVVAGRTTFHLVTCRLVQDRTDLQRMSPDDAGARGLAPCRICDAVSATA